MAPPAADSCDGSCCAAELLELEQLRHQNAQLRWAVGGLLLLMFIGIFVREIYEERERAQKRR